MLSEFKLNNFYRLNWAMAESTKELPPDISSDFVKVIAETIGISTGTEESYKFLAEDVTFRSANFFSILHIVGRF